MSLVGELLGEATSASPIGAIIKAGEELIDRLVPDTNARAREKAAYIEAVRADAAKAMADQREINKVEAASPSVFVAGWRPALGWILDICVGLYFIPKFLIGIGLWVWACKEAGAMVPSPDLGIGDVLALLGALLGVSIPRTVEKIWGVATKQVGAIK